MSDVPRNPSDHSTPAASEFDRTVLPVAEPSYPPITELDARDAKAPPRFEVKAPKGAPNVVVIRTPPAAANTVASAVFAQFGVFRDNRTTCSLSMCASTVIPNRGGLSRAEYGEGGIICAVIWTPTLPRGACRGDARHLAA